MPPLPELDPEAFARLQQELAGEAVLWAGRPSERVMFWRAALIWLFALPWCAFAFFWEHMALSAFFAESEREVTGAAKIASVVFPLFGIPFVLIGLWMLGAPFRAAYKARRLVHILTEKRLIKAELGRTLVVTSIDPAQIVSIKMEQKANGTGTLHLNLGMVPSMAPMGPDLPMVTGLRERIETIYGVPDVAGLERALRARMASLPKG